MGGGLNAADQREAEQREAEETAAAAAAELAELRARGFPKPGSCLRCDRPHLITRPSDRLCRRCRHLNEAGEVVTPGVATWLNGAEAKQLRKVAGEVDAAFDWRRGPRSAATRAKMSAAWTAERRAKMKAAAAERRAT